MIQCFILRACCAVCVDLSWRNACWVLHHLKTWGRKGEILSGQQLHQLGQMCTLLAAASHLSERAGLGHWVHGVPLRCHARSWFSLHRSAFAAQEPSTQLPRSYRKASPWMRLWGLMGIVLAGQVQPRGAPVPGSSLSEASLLRLITVQVGKTLGDFWIKRRISSKWIAQRKDCFEGKLVFFCKLCTKLSSWVPRVCFKSYFL